jgi:hypothetical protein
VSQEEVVAEAHRHAALLITEAEELAERMRRETDDYVDAKLANFEVVLTKTLAAVSRGRDKVRGRSDLADIADRAGGASAAVPAEAPAPEGEPYDLAAQAAPQDAPYDEPPFEERPFDERPYDEPAADGPAEEPGEAPHRLGYGPPRW